jgi:hypothetical protein
MHQLCTARQRRGLLDENLPDGEALTQSFYLFRDGDHFAGANFITLHNFDGADITAKNAQMVTMHP